MQYKYKKQHFIIGLAILLISTSVNATFLERIVAIVEDDVILEGELRGEIQSVVNNLKKNKVTIPPLPILKKQVLERLIINKLQIQFAQRSGISVSDTMLSNAVADIAKTNKLTTDGLRQELQGLGMSFQDFENNIRDEITINQLRNREISTRIKVTDREISHYLETQGVADQSNIQYHLGHILISTPEAASSSVIQKARQKAEKVLADLQKGADFKTTAITVSDGINALQGGDLGWRTLAEIPTLFVDYVGRMQQGDIADLMRSPSGFHILKILALKGADKHVVTKTKSRHILIKTNELIDDAEAKKRLLALKMRIVSGDDFATLARSHSEDQGTAINGGDLGWVGLSDLVPAFGDAMQKLTINEISDPVQTQFGWHIMQVLARQEKDDNVKFKKNQAKEIIRKRKIEEETELWLRRLRDEAFVIVHNDRL